MDHPEVLAAIKTGYPHIDYLDRERYQDTHYPVANHPVEDMYGCEIRQGDKYFTDPQGKVVLMDNLQDYLQDEVGVVFYEAK
ncbi:hypothetical protein NCCP2222_19530 [Sporosarcina sp. NCCP-2222]|uniref:YqaI family protein n=1 Tax=Sporosarcina sp. NCCP-2222 TaxID=2935073 RepID=UPI00208BA14E|nr:hypothetical protein [Sporosarcina sp. NCCP-2222]GKV56006.1 hypothetical protein NCCP2222_19530 [Sporosarcina sp. NCCP-2222]